MRQGREALATLRAPTTGGTVTLKQSVEYLPTLIPTKGRMNREKA